MKTVEQAVAQLQEAVDILNSIGPELLSVETVGHTLNIVADIQRWDEMGEKSRTILLQRIAVLHEMAEKLRALPHPYTGPAGAA